ncbi:type II secretion system protein [bacterium]|nr:type II secretion system protein [bacterium]
MKIKSNTGFTLAEILITIGIIGVVAALTIPSLINNIRANQYRQTLKKTISTLSQSARLSQAQYGFDFSGINSTCKTDNDTPENTQSICAILNGTLNSFTFYRFANLLKDKNGNAYNITTSYSNAHAHLTTDTMKAYQLQNGSIIMISQMLGTKNCSLIGTLKDTYLTEDMQYCYGFIDVNGTNPPNKEIKCTTGSNSLTGNNCIVKSKDITDIYPIRIHDAIVEPATASGRFVLKSAK